jgi:hypothetical protein
MTTQMQGLYDEISGGTIIFNGRNSSWYDISNSLQVLFNEKLSLTGGYMTGDLHIFGPTISNIAGHRLFSTGGNTYYDTYGSETYFRTGNYGASQQPLKWDTSGNILLCNNTINISNTGNITNGTINGKNISYIDMTSSIQTQLNNKFDKSGGTITGNLTCDSNIITNAILQRQPNQNIFISLMNTPTSYIEYMTDNNNSVATMILDIQSSAVVSGAAPNITSYSLHQDVNIVKSINSITPTQLSYLTTLSSNVQNQLNNKVEISSLTEFYAMSYITDISLNSKCDLSGFEVYGNIIVDGNINTPNNITADNIIIKNNYGTGNAVIFNEFAYGNIFDFDMNLRNSGRNTSFYGLMFRLDARYDGTQAFQFISRNANSNVENIISYINSTGDYIKSSDATKKNNIVILNQEKSYERIKNTDIYSYFYNNQSEDDIKQNRKCIGVLAQEIQNSNKHCIQEYTNSDNTKNLAVDYNSLFLHNMNATRLIIKKLEKIENSLTIPDNPPLIKQNGIIIEESININDLLNRINILENQIILQQNQINEHQKIILLLKKNINKLK